VLAMEPATDWDDSDPGLSPDRSAELLPVTVQLRLPNAIVRLRGELPEQVRDGLVDLMDEGLHLGPDPVEVDLVLSFSGSWQLSGHSPGEIIEAPDAVSLLDRLVEVLDRLAVATDPRRLHLRAACVRLDATGVVIAAPHGQPIGAVMVELLRLGADYLAENCTTLLPGSRTVFGHPGPLVLGRGSVELLSPLVPAEDFPAISDRGRATVRASSSGRSVVHCATAGAVVLPRWSRDEEPAMRPITATDAGVRLLGHVRDREHFAGAALESIASLVGGASCWELVFRDPTRAAVSIMGVEPRRGRELVVLHDLGGGVRAARIGDAGLLVTGRSPAEELSSGEIDAVESLLVQAPAPDGSAEHLERLRAAELLGEVAAPRPVPPIEAYGLSNCPSGAAAAAMWSRDGSAIERVQRVASGDAPTAAVGPVAQALLAGAIEVPGADRDAVLRLHREARGEVFRVESVLFDVLRRVEEVGVVPLVLGDPVHAHDGVLPEEFTDAERVDLLVDRDQFRTVVDLLLESGYSELGEEQAEHRDPDDLSPGGPTDEGVLLEAPTGGVQRQPVTVRVHTSLAVGPFGGLVATEELHERSVPVRLGGRWCRALHPEDRFVSTCVLVDQDSGHSSVQDLRDVVLTAPHAEHLMEHAMEASERWAASRAVTRTLLRLDGQLPGLPSWLVERARRDLADPPRRRNRRRR
jgi:hypothetical protein